MKKFFLILSAAFITASALAKIPAKVTGAFQARYAGATNVEWKHGIGNYKAYFNMGEYKFLAKFDRKGGWLESEKMLKKDKLPITVKNNLRKSKYSQWEIKSSYIEYLPNEKPFYRIITAKGDFKRKNLIFDDQGQLING
jgi:Putative beta-lactamase-inhibitor-like, PepSY-like